MDASATTEAGWARAIEPGRANGRLVAESLEPGAEAQTVQIPGWIAPDLNAALLGSGISGLYSHQLEALEASRDGNVVVTSGTASGKSLCFNLPVLDELARDDRRRALYLYPTKALAQDQAQEALGARATPAPPRDLRRRHAARRPAADPPPLEPDPHQPRHAPRRDPAPPQELGRFPREPRLGRGRRGAHLPRRLRLARRECAPAPAQSRAPLRRRAALRARVRHDRQPARARRGPRRGAVPPGGLGRRPARPAANRDVEPTGHRPAIDDPPFGSLGGRGAPGRPGGRGDADDLLPSQPARHRADPALHPHAARGAGARRSSPSGSPPTGPATPPSSAARSRRASPGATCSPSSRPTRSSSESTSATWTLQSA